MKIIYKTAKLKKTFADDKIGKHYGESARKIKMRLQALAAANSLEDLREMPGKWHALKGDRDGQFACHLSGPHRLVFEACLPCDSEDIDFSNWMWITEVKILEVVDYHD